LCEWARLVLDNLGGAPGAPWSYEHEGLSPLYFADVRLCGVWPDKHLLLRGDHRERFEPRHSSGTLAHYSTRSRHRAGRKYYLRSRGVYEELVRINASGDASDGFITFRSYPGETAILDASHLTPSGRTGVLTIQNKSYVRIEGFEIRNFRTAEHRLSPLGINVIGSGSHI